MTDKEFTAEYLDKPIPYELEKKKVIAVDVDDTLTDRECWNKTDMVIVSPKKEVIKWVNKMYERNFIVIHTARRDCFYEVTVDWLNKHGVKYHAIKMGKMPASVYLDDKALNVEDL